MQKDKEDLLKKYCELLEKRSNHNRQTKKIGGNALATLVATGTPIAAVSFSGAVSGLSASGITSGLATLGIGSMAGGIASIAGIGVLSFLGVKWVVSKF